jgi:hypothetical protein
MLQEQGEQDDVRAHVRRYFNDEKDPQSWTPGANGLGCSRSKDHGHAIKERQRPVSVLTNQCLGKETNTEPPGRGAEELPVRTQILPDRQQQIYSRELRI